MYNTVAMFIILMLTVVGCTSSPLSTGIPEESLAPPELGIATDEGLTVIAVQSGSAAEKADVQVGDRLVDITWTPAEESDDSTAGGIVMDDDGTVRYNGEVITEPVAIPAPTLSVEEVVGKEAVPFTARDQIRDLVRYGLPLKLRVVRNDQELELTIVPTLRAERLAIPEDSHDYF